MKASHLLRLIENSKTKSVPGELGKQAYQNDHSPSNHINGKKMKQVTVTSGEGKRDKKPRADVGSPAKRERRKMEGPSTKARKMSEALSAKEIGSMLMGTSRDASTGMQAIQLKDNNRGQVISVPLSNPKAYQALLTAIKSNDDNLAMRAYNMLINDPNASLSDGNTAFSGKESGAMEKGAHSGGARMQRGGDNIGRAMSQDQIAAAANKFSLANSKGSKETRLAKRVKESGGERGDSMGKETVNTGGAVSKSATVKTMPVDKKPSADVGSVKKKEKRSMDANKAPVKDFKGGENEHKSMSKMHEAAMSDLENWLGTDINIVTEVSQEEMLKQIQAKAEQSVQYRGGNTGELETFYLDMDNPSTCPHCGTRTDFDTNSMGTEEDPQHHKCMNKKCEFEFKGEFEDEGEFDEDEGDYMDRKKKIAGRKDNPATAIRPGSTSTRSKPGKGYRRS